MAAGGLFVVVNWAGPGRAYVILGKACFLSTRLLSLSLLPHSSTLLISLVSLKKTRCGVYC